MYIYFISSRAFEGGYIATGTHDIPEQSLLLIDKSSTDKKWTSFFEYKYVLVYNVNSGIEYFPECLSMSDHLLNRKLNLKSLKLGINYQI